MRRASVPFVLSNAIPQHNVSAQRSFTALIMTGIGSVEHDCSFLPPELWDLVVRHLPAADQRHCLSVSRLFYELVHPRVFAQVTIHLGIWNADTDEGHGEAHTQLLERRKIRNTELFQRIAEDTRFAQIVKGMTVRADKGEFAQLDIGRLYIQCQVPGLRGI